MKLSRILCLVRLHRWRFSHYEFQSYGMGLERFEVFRCERCKSVGDQLRGEPRTFRNHGKEPAVSE